MNGVITLCALVLGLAVALVATPVRADSYYWGGRVDNLEVSILGSGFEEGGEGWTVEDARAFVAAAKAIARRIPANRFVRVEATETQSAVHVKVFECNRARCPGKLLRAVPTQISPFGYAMRNIEHLVARALDVKVEPSIPPRTAAGILGLTVGRDKPKPPTLFTIRLFAAATRNEAEERASALQERDPEVTGHVFWNECMPCASTLVRILEPTVGRASDEGAGNEFVVHLGAFVTRPIATAALAELKRKYGLTGTVIELQ